MSERAFPYPDNITPQFIYRKSISETPTSAYAKAGAKAKSFIPKYGETAALALAVNFAINILNEDLRDYVHTRYASITSLPAVDAWQSHILQKKLLFLLSFNLPLRRGSGPIFLGRGGMLSMFSTSPCSPGAFRDPFPGAWLSLAYQIASYL